MKVIFKREVGNYSIIVNVADAPVDTVKTNQKIEPMITPDMTGSDVERLYMGNLVCANYGSEADVVDDSVGEIIQKKLDARGENRQLLDSGEYIDDYRGAEYYTKQTGRWCKDKIEEIGIKFAHGEIPVAELTPEIQAEINAQHEEEKIAAMAPEEKEIAKQAALDALADEADRQARRAEIQKRKFDPSAWYTERASVIEQKYA